ncbi:MAG: polysaccharide pyruvyl transferase family protein [Sedimentisphaerales bacterium]|nr:polysaccharide pyruvyl transferase family protein [Sedimentisphaerales bacterium]
MNVLVINQCSTNKGDRAVLYYVLKALKQEGIENVTVSASNPQYWHEKPDYPSGDVKVIPWGWNISRKKNTNIFVKIFHLFCKVKLPRQIYFPLVRNAIIAGKCPWYLRLLVNKEYLEALQKADIVISTGGHHLTTIIAGHIRTPQIFDMAIALLYNKPLLLWSQSVGTFKFMSPSSKPMIQEILSGSGKVFIRDEASLDEIEKLEVSTEHVFKTRESVFGLYDVVKSRIAPSKREPILGVSVWTGNKQNPNTWNDYIRCFADLINYAIETGGFKQIRFFPMELQGSDRSCIEDIVKLVNKKELCNIIEDFPGTEEHINLISQCRMYVGHKTHSQIFSLVAGTPLLAIAYHKKTEDFMTQFSLGKYCIVDTQLSSGKFIELFNQINENLDLISEKEQETAFGMFQRVQSDFSEMIKDYRN